MRHDHLARELDLIVLLAQNRQYKADEICQKLGISRRSFYYYIDFFRFAGFKVEKHGTYYSLSRTSKFFTKLFDLVQLTEDEALLMRQLIENAGMESGRLRSLHQKLDKFYDFKILEDEALHRKTMAIRSMLYEAVKMKQCVEIVGYSSPNSHSVRNRLVEPFMFLNNNKDIRAYEHGSGINKTFRLSRMQDVVVQERHWEHEERHRMAFMDLFSFSGERKMRVMLLMGQLSHNVMLEEYPDSATCFERQSDGRWLFTADVCSYLGIGRFVLGLYDDIEVLSDDGFREYLRGKLQAFSSRVP